MCCAWLAGNAGPKKSPKSRYLGTIAQLCRAISSQLRHVLTIGKKLVKQQYLLHMSHSMVNFGLLAAEISLVVLGTPANFNGLRILTALLHGTLVVGVSQTLRLWTEGATYIRQGPSRWALAHISSLILIFNSSQSSFYRVAQKMRPLHWIVTSSKFMKQYSWFLFGSEHNY